MPNYAVIDEKAIKPVCSNLIINADEILVHDSYYADLILKEAKERATIEILEALKDVIEFKFFQVDPLSHQIRLSASLKVFDGDVIPLGCFSSGVATYAEELKVRNKEHEKIREEREKLRKENGGT